MLKNQGFYGKIGFMKMVFLIMMFMIGAAMGSFLGCQVWRLRYRNTKKKSLGKWSVCLHCKKRLKWYDNVPILSWLILGGKCRYCKKKIGGMEILVEILMAISFLCVASLFDFASAGILEWVGFVIKLLFLISLGFLAIYDGMWGELPSFVLLIAGTLSVMLFGINLMLVGFSWNIVINTLIAVGVLGGLYLVLYLVSKGTWVGDGDWILGVILAIALSDAWLALILLFIANMGGALIMMPVIAKRKRKKIYFGPFLVLAYVITFVFANFFRSLIGF